MIQLATTYKSIILIFLFALIQCNILFGQLLFSPDPYKIKFDNLNFEHTKAEVTTYKIKRVTSKEYKIKRHNLKNEIPKSDFYIVEFNEAGNPVSYQYKSYKETTDTANEVRRMSNYVFEYDTLDNLVHVQEYKISYLSSSHDENDVYFFYDKNNNLIKEVVSRKYVYDPEYGYGDKIIPPDTSLIKYIFNYDDANKVTVVFRNEYGRYSKKTWLDTLKFNCSFDSVFIEKYVPKGVEKDQEGRIIENTRYAMHVLLKGGGCYSPDNPADVITKFYYGKNGKLIKSESRTRKGKFLRRRYWTYNEKGLLQSIQVEKSDRIILYEYEFY